MEDEGAHLHDVVIRAVSLATHEVVVGAHAFVSGAGHACPPFNCKWLIIGIRVSTSYKLAQAPVHEPQVYAQSTGQPRTLDGHSSPLYDGGFVILTVLVCFPVVVLQDDQSLIVYSHGTTGHDIVAKACTWALRPDKSPIFV